MCLLGSAHTFRRFPTQILVLLALATCSCKALTRAARMLANSTARPDPACLEARLIDCAVLIVPMTCSGPEHMSAGHMRHVAPVPPSRSCSERGAVARVLHPTLLLPDAANQVLLQTLPGISVVGQDSHRHLLTARAALLIAFTSQRPAFEACS